MTPGLANKLCFRSAQKICCNFPETLGTLPHKKAILTGTPIRRELLQGNKIAGLNLCGFTANKPVILVMGGSLGAANVNKAVRDALPLLLENYQIVHLCGKGKLDESLLNTPGYRQFEYVKAELKDLFAMADVIVSRAGANAICELLALKKPNILIPLPAASSRGDQILNAKSFEAQGFSIVLQEETLTTELLKDKINELYAARQTYIDTMTKSPQDQAITLIADLLDRLAKKAKK
jgi:UDP-N-acetylglucosamine--N-acetylmuramyl-(pentapeptide) pyrophosphoryl-undecaprenol N-acetylglucosamine transferase